MSKFSFSNKSSRFSFQQNSGSNTGGGDDLPNRLKEYDQWLVTHDTPWNEQRHKSPKYPAEGWNDGDLLSFEEAHSRAEQVANTALAFCFVEDGPFVGFDLDDVTRDSTFTDEARRMVRRLDSYTETSTSGTGVHVIAVGEHLADRPNRADLDEQGHLEVYDRDRYFVLTGDVYNDHSTIKERTDAAEAVQEAHLPEQQSPDTGGTRSALSDQAYTDETEGVTPDQVYRTIEAYVEHADHDVDEELLRLWNGSDGGRKSASEADLALASQLYYWCKGDPRLMDDCFRASGRMRPKWDEQRGDQTYGELTIRKACQSNHDTFGGRYTT